MSREITRQHSIELNADSFEQLISHINELIDTSRPQQIFAYYNYLIL